MKRLLDRPFFRRPLVGLRFLAALVLAAAAAAAPAQTAPAEAQKIEQLIASVERLGDAKFIRNDSAYDANAAADHLRLKLREAGTRVKSAEDFIRLVAAKSSVSGQPYWIRFADGKSVTSEAFLRARLAEIGKLGR